MNRTLTILILILLAAGTVKESQACLDAPQRHVISGFDALCDSTPPSTPHLTVRKIIRGKGAKYVGNGLMEMMSTNDLGMVSVDVTNLLDDQTPASGIGLRIINLNEDSKTGKQMAPSYDIKCSGSITLSWIDGSRHIQEPLSELFAVYAIDAAGNLSVEADTLSIVDPGRGHSIPEISVDVSSDTIIIERGQEFSFDVRVTNISSEPVRITKDIKSSIILKVLDPSGKRLSANCLFDIPSCEPSPIENFILIEPGKSSEKTITLSGLPLTKEPYRLGVIYWWKSCPDWPVERNTRIESGSIPFTVLTNENPAEQ